MNTKESVKKYDEVDEAGGKEEPAVAGLRSSRR